MASKEKPSDIIRKARKNLTEALLQIDQDLILDEADSHLLLTLGEYYHLSEIENPRVKLEKLIDIVLAKEDSAHELFLDYLNNLKCKFPNLHPISEYVEVECSLPEEKTKKQSAPKEAKKDVSKDFSDRKEEDETRQEPQQEKKHHAKDRKEEDETRQEPQQEKEHDAKERSEALQNIFSELQLLRQKSKKLTLQETLEISSGSLKQDTPHSLEDLPWHFLRKVLALNVTARNTSLEQGTADGEKLYGMGKENSTDDNFSIIEMATNLSMNPLDLLCALLLCSDSFLQQEIFSKMSLCQFALPLLLPPLESPKCTLMLWAMRDIVKKWRPHSLAGSRGFEEKSLVLISMPIISFVRLGSSNLSKSKILNDFLSPAQQHHDFFTHRDMEGGHIPRKIADGLVEIAWYFPGGRESSDLFSDPVAVTNLRGDIESNWVQFSFLTEVSAAVFIFVEHISEKDYNLLLSLKESSTQYYFILEYGGGRPEERLDFLKKLAPVLKFDKSHVLLKVASANKAEFMGKLRSIVRRIICASPKHMNFQNMSDRARELNILVDEESQDCQNALQHAEQITKGIKNVADYKKEMLKLQGDLWKNLAIVEKELCRMEKQGARRCEEYRSELKIKSSELREQQHKCELTIGLHNFLNGLVDLSSRGKQYFLKWMKFNLDSIARENRSRLRAAYKDKCKTVGNDDQTIVEIDRQIASSSLGIEHFMRELGQFYEAEYSMVKEGRIPKTRRRFLHFPGVAADLMLEGFPLELIDGDASNVPLQWVTDILAELNKKVKGRSKMIVITVLGVQGTGKSTLLNTMFGLQFPVSSGRCTRGAFMTLLRVREDMAQELGCDFVLVIDTEGLKAPELAELEESYQHDNELATFVIGLSDITIVNMAMENATEMKDVLQIVTHAFLRMERIGQKPNCHFVHQNVSEVCAHDQNMRDRNRLLEQLNEMTQAAAKMEKVDRNIKFSDIIDYDSKMNNWYIPGLWHGVPPMAPVNMGYSEKVFELKQHLIQSIRSRSHKRPPKDIPAFIEWVKNLWNAVKYENFIFSFRNSLIAEAYNNLSVKYSEWDWSSRKEMHLWVSEQENKMQNVFPQIDPSMLKCELQQKLSMEEEKILKNLDQYFESGAANLHLIKKYREDFVRNAHSLKRELERSLCKKLDDAIDIKEGQHKIEALQKEYLKTIERKVDQLLEECKRKEHPVEEQFLKTEFERMWKETLSELSPVRLNERDIYADVELLLRKSVESQSKLVTQKLQEKGGLLSYRANAFKVKDKHIESKWWPKLFHPQDYLLRLQEISTTLISNCTSYIDAKVHSKEDYVSAYCGELLFLISQKLQEDRVQKLQITPVFEVDLKLHILGEAAHRFQKMHEDFIEENDPRKRLEKLKPHYFSTFKDLYQEKDAQQIRAKDFCDRCLRPALEDHITKRLGIEIVDQFCNSECSFECSSRNFFQFTLLKELLDEWKFEQYVKYITNYEGFVKNWIWKRIMDCCMKNGNLKDLEKDILSGILRKVKNTLEILKTKDAATFAKFVDNFRLELQKDLAVSKSNLVSLEFRNAFDAGQFSAYVEAFLPDLQKEILSQYDLVYIENKLSGLSVKPQDEIFKHVFGCGKQCPFCNVPCEAGGGAHKEHFAAVHRPKALGRYRFIDTEKLTIDICSSSVASTATFRNTDTNWEPHPYKNYRDYYPEWCIQPDPSLSASDYWKFVLKEFNHDFAREYEAEPADLPEDWKKITKEQALQALRESYNMKETSLP